MRQRRYFGGYLGQLRGCAQVDNQWVGGGPLLGRKNAGHRRGVERVRPQPIHRFGWEGHQLAAPKRRSGLGNRGWLGVHGIDWQHNRVKWMIFR